MFGKVVNFAGELSENRVIPGDIFKRIVAGEEIQAQFKNQNPFVFVPECAQWFNSNHLPKTRDSSEGFTRRWLILDFNNIIDAAKRVLDLDQQILEHERQAIVAWAMQGYKRLTESSRFTLPTSHQMLIEQMAVDNNSVRQFLTSSGSRLNWGAEYEISLMDLHTEYWQFMLMTGSSNRLGIPKFANAMKELSGSLPFNINTREGNPVYYSGVGTS